MALKSDQYLFICDKQPGACKGWLKCWSRCENDFCYHTSNIEHARNCVDGKISQSQKFIVISVNDKNQYWEYTGKCTEPFKCMAQLEVEGRKYCIDGECPLNHGACQE